MPTDLPLPKNEELVALLHGWKSRSPGDHADFFTALLKAMLIVPISTEGAPDSVKPMLLVQGTESFLAAFTDEAAYRTAFAAGSPVRPLHVVGRELCEAVAANGPDGVVLNGAGPVSYTLRRAQCRQLAEGRVTDLQGASLDAMEEDVHIGRPVGPLPQPLWERLLEVVARPGVRRVYWFWVRYGEDKEATLGLAVDPPTKDAVDAIGAAVQKEQRLLLEAKLPSGGAFVVMPLEGELRPIIEEVGSMLYPRGG